jgi:hypothetical protein
MATPFGETTVQRFLDPQRVLRLAVADFAPIFAAYVEHARRWELPLDATTRALAEPGLAAMTLHTATRLADESCGVTLNLLAPPTNLFLSGDTGAGTVTGRIFTEDVETAATGRMFVQSFRQESGVVQTVLDVYGRDVLAMFEEYYARSLQQPARFVHLDGDRYGVIQALPDGGRERILGLDAAAARALFEGPMQLLVEQVFRFRCGCSPVKIARALHEMFAGRGDDLFAGDPGVEAFCPRCGARWWIDRTTYDAGEAHA